MKGHQTNLSSFPNFLIEILQKVSLRLLKKWNNFAIDPGRMKFLNVDLISLPSIKSRVNILANSLSTDRGKRENRFGMFHSCSVNFLSFDSCYSNFTKTKLMYIY